MVNPAAVSGHPRTRRTPLRRYLDARLAVQIPAVRGCEPRLLICPFPFFGSQSVARASDGPSFPPWASLADGPTPPLRLLDSGVPSAHLTPSPTPPPFREALPHLDSRGNCQASRNVTHSR